MKHLTFALFVVVLVGLPTRGQDISAKGQVVAGFHEVDMKSGMLYSVKIDAKGFIPRVNMMPGRLPFGGQDFSKPESYQGYYMSTNDEKNMIVILPDIFSLKGKGPFDYTIEVKGLPLAAKPILEVKGELTQNDPPFKVDFNMRPRHKSFELKTKANQMYVIDMRSPEASMLDDYLYLLDSNNKVVKFDDDGGGFPHARIVFQAPKDGDYRIIASGLGEALGKFVLTVRTTEAK